jgi:hypothetical protein
MRKFELRRCHSRRERHNVVILVLELEAFAQPLRGLGLLPTSFKGLPGLPEVANETIAMEIIGFLRACKFQVSCSFVELSTKASIRGVRLRRGLFVFIS